MTTHWSEKAFPALVGAVVLLFVLWAVGPGPLAGAGRGAQAGRYGEEGLRVTGTAVVRAKPDLATVSLGYGGRGSSAREAKRLSDDAMRRVIAAVKSEGVQAKDIQTTDYSLYSTWEKPKGAPGRLVWHVRNMVEVRVHRVDTVSSVIDAAMSAGADTMRGVSFSVEDLSKLRAQAREKAARAARDKAEQLARLMNVRLGRVVAVEDSTGQEYPRFAYAANAMAEERVARSSAAESEVSEGQITVQAREDVVFELR